MHFETSWTGRFRRPGKARVDPLTISRLRGSQAKVVMDKKRPATQWNEDVPGIPAASMPSPVVAQTPCNADSKATQTPGQLHMYDIENEPRSGKNWRRQADQGCARYSRGQRHPLALSFQLLPTNPLKKIPGANQGRSFSARVLENPWPLLVWDATRSIATTLIGGGSLFSRVCTAQVKCR